jgi:hypothetical protein
MVNMKLTLDLTKHHAMKRIRGWVDPRAGLDTAAAKRKITVIAPAENRTHVVQPVA